MLRVGQSQVTVVLNTGNHPRKGREGVEMLKNCVLQHNGGNRKCVGYRLKNGVFFRKTATKRSIFRQGDWKPQSSLGLRFSEGANKSCMDRIPTI